MLFRSESYLMEQREAEALSVLRQYVEKHPRNYVARTRLGEVYIQLQRFPEAEQTLLRIPYSKRNPYVQFLLAKIQAGLGHQAQAESMLRDLVKKEPNMLEAWSELAFLLESRKDFAGALKIYEMLLPQDLYCPALRDFPYPPHKGGPAFPHCPHRDAGRSSPDFA